MSSTTDIVTLSADVTTFANDALALPTADDAFGLLLRCNDLLGRTRTLLDTMATVDPQANASITDPLDMINAMTWAVDSRYTLRLLRTSLTDSRDALTRLALGAVRTRVHYATSRETLHAVAAKTLGDPGLYWKIAAANGISPGAVLTDGQELVIPEG